tara:strand:- start:486 stop:686 length:201 start_codon:yes stop_codon:yes gene_type:complete
MSYQEKAAERAGRPKAPADEHLRDQFAMAALTGIIAGPPRGRAATPESDAKAAYQAADAMMEQRKK